MKAWESTPRIAFLSPEPGSGKSRALEVTELLVPRPVHAVNTSPPYLFRKVSDPDGPPTLMYDEIDTLFGPKAKDNEDVRGMLNAGHRRGAMAGRCVVRGKTVETEELPAYCAVALAGLDDLPDTIATRSIIVRMRRRAPSERVEPFRHRVHREEGHAIRDALASWADLHAGDLEDAWPEMPDGIEDRNADVWEALLAVADAAGGPWPERARAAAVTLVTDVTDSAAGRGSLGVRLLADLRDVFTAEAADRLPTVTILDRLHDLDESPWADLRGKPLDARGLSNRLGRYGVKRRTTRAGDDVFKGYEAADLHDAWARYLKPADILDRYINPVTVVTDVTDPQDGTGPAATDQTAADVKAYLIEQVGVDEEVAEEEAAPPPPPDSSVTSVTTVTPAPAGARLCTDCEGPTEAPGFIRCKPCTDARMAGAAS